MKSTRIRALEPVCNALGIELQEPGSNIKVANLSSIFEDLLTNSELVEEQSESTVQNLHALAKSVRCHDLCSTDCTIITIKNEQSATARNVLTYHDFEVDVIDASPCSPTIKKEQLIEVHEISYVDAVEGMSNSGNEIKTQQGFPVSVTATRSSSRLAKRSNRVPRNPTDDCHVHHKTKKYLKQKDKTVECKQSICNNIDKDINYPARKIKVKDTKDVFGEEDGYNDALTRSTFIDKTDPENKLQCQICAKICSHIANLKRHILSHTSVRQQHVCAFCDHMFKSASRLRSHLNSHTGDRPFVCPHCNKSFADSEYFVKHKRIHGSERHFLCQLCGKDFIFRKSFAMHMRVHSGERPHICSVCGNGFSQSCTLQVHMRRHTNEKPYQCSSCPKRFTVAKQLKIHALTVHLTDEEKPFHCEQCNKGFAKNFILQNHMRTHEKPFSCQQCGKCFATRGKVEKHCLVCKLNA